jgi:hypothetical protein
MSATQAIDGEGTMARFSTRYFNWIWVAVAVCYGSCTSAYGDREESQPTLVFRVVNDGQVSQEVVETAKAHVEHIYGHSGIQVEWSDADEANPASNGNGKLDLTIVFVPESVAQTMGRTKEATGFAASNDGQGLRRAYIFVERVAQQAVVVHRNSTLEEKTAKGLILGEVIAHEAGHLMLPYNSHSPRGIMQARLNLDSVEQGRRGILLFTPDQTKVIRAILSRVEGN